MNDKLCFCPLAQGSTAQRARAGTAADGPAFSAIDDSVRLPLRRALRAGQHTLQQRCVSVTHDRAEAPEQADDVAMRLDGRLAHLGTPAELLSRRAS